MTRLALVALVVFVLACSAATASLPPPADDPVPYQPPPIIVCHESRVVPSAATWGIGSTIVCQSRGVVAG